MIDPHVHLRDWREAGKETLRHGLAVARRAGLDAVFEMPNTDPPLTSRAVVERRLECADAVLRENPGLFHGLYAGLTADPEQIRDVVSAHAAHFPRVVGLKLFAGHSTGEMGVIGEEEQRGVYRTLARLGYRGVLAVHAEKESLLRRTAGGAPDWDPRHPDSYARARPPEAEVSSVEDQIRLAAEEGFRGVLHIAHVSVPESLTRIREARGRGLPCRLSSGITPHHALLGSEEMEGPAGLLLKTNPPLRPRAMQRSMLAALLAREIDWVESDHAPHTLVDKLERHASGIPSLAFHPRFVRILGKLGMPPTELDAVTHGRVEEVFGFSVARSEAIPAGDLASEYPFDPFGTAKAVVEPVVSIIVALDSAGLIGRQGRLPWHLPEDLKHFRRTTLGHPVVMGRKTFEGLPRPLDGRRMVVMSRGADFRAPEGVGVARSVSEALSSAMGEELFVAGGREVYAEFLPLADRLYVTMVDGEHQGDTSFPALDWREWALTEERRGEGVKTPGVLFRLYHRIRIGSARGPGRP